MINSIRILTHVCCLTLIVSSVSLLFSTDDKIKTGLSICLMSCFSVSYVLLFRKINKTEASGLPPIALLSLYLSITNTERSLQGYGVAATPRFVFFVVGTFLIGILYAYIKKAPQPTAPPPARQDENQVA